MTSTRPVAKTYENLATGSSCLMMPVPASTSAAGRARGVLPRAGPQKHFPPQFGQKTSKGSGLSGALAGRSTGEV